MCLPGRAIKGSLPTTGPVFCEVPRALQTRQWRCASESRQPQRSRQFCSMPARAAATVYEAPSNVGGATELEALSAMTQVVPDSVLMASEKDIPRKAATVSAGVLGMHSLPVTACSAHQASSHDGIAIERLAELFLWQTMGRALVMACPTAAMLQFRWLIPHRLVP